MKGERQFTRNAWENKAETFQVFFRDLGEPSEGVWEASRTWGMMFDLLEGLPEVHSVTLAHPQKVRAIAATKIKTGKIDARILAQLLRADLAPAAYIQGKETRLLKGMVRRRVFLARTRTWLKNRIMALQSPVLYLLYLQLTVAVKKCKFWVIIFKKRRRRVNLVDGPYD